MNIIENKSGKIRIVSDGTPPGTKVFVVREDGGLEWLPYISKVTWTLDAQGIAKATIDFISVDVDVLGDELAEVERKPLVRAISECCESWVEVNARNYECSACGKRCKVIPPRVYEA